MNCTFCDMPFDSACTFLSAVADSPRRASHESASRARRRGARPSARRSSGAAADRHLLVEAALLGQVADAVVRRDRTAVAENVDRAAVRQQDVHDHPQRRRLARAVGSDEAVDHAFGHLQRQRIDGHRLAEALADRVESDG